MSEVKYPDVEVQLPGEDGNAVVLVGAVAKGMRRAGIEAPEIDAFREEATSGDYDHLLRTCMKWVSVT